MDGKKEPVTEGKKMVTDNKTEEPKPEPKPDKEQKEEATLEEIVNSTRNNRDEKSDIYTESPAQENEPSDQAKKSEGQGDKKEKKRKKRSLKTIVIVFLLLVLSAASLTLYLTGREFEYSNILDDLSSHPKLGDEGKPQVTPTNPVHTVAPTRTAITTTPDRNGRRPMYGPGKVSIVPVNGTNQTNGRA